MNGLAYKDERAKGGGFITVPGWGQCLSPFLELFIAAYGNYIYCGSASTQPLAKTFPFRPGTIGGTGPLGHYTGGRRGGIIPDHTATHRLAAISSSVPTLIITNPVMATFR